MSVPVDLLKTILVENLDLAQHATCVPRNLALEPDVPTIFVGLYGTGKSFCLFQRMRELVAEGHAWEEFLYVNFEDERLLEFEVEDFSRLLQAHRELYDVAPILFLDEVQNIPGWEKFARRMADEKKLTYVTGSNAAMLSREMAASLGGRYLVREVFPYSFAEYLRANGLEVNAAYRASTAGRTELKRQVEEFLIHGGFPEAVGRQYKRPYLQTLYRKIYLSDIAVRYGIDNTGALEMMLKRLAEGVGQPQSISRLTGIVKSTGVAVGKTTISNYLDDAAESMLLLPLQNFAAKFAERQSIAKYYFNDQGLLSLFLIDRLPAHLENTVAHDLLRRFGTEDAVFYYADRRHELDFYVPREQTAVQVSYSLRYPETQEREMKSLVNCGKYLGCKRFVIVTYDDPKRHLEREGVTVEVLPVIDWLLREDTERR